MNIPICQIQCIVAQQTIQLFSNHLFPVCNMCFGSAWNIACFMRLFYETFFEEFNGGASGAEVLSVLIKRGNIRIGDFTPFSTVMILDVLESRNHYISEEERDSLEDELFENSHYLPDNMRGIAEFVEYVWMLDKREADARCVSSNNFTIHWPITTRYRGLLESVPKS